MENQRKNEDPLKKIERTLTLIFIGLGVIVIIGIMFLIKFSGDKGRISEPPAKVEEPAEALSDSTSFLPDNCNLFETIPSFEFIDEAGSTHSIEEFQGKVTVVTFWASWCDDCKEQLPLMNDFLKMTEEAGANYILIDKLDDEKETKEAAISYLTEQEITAGTYFDEDMQAYELLGMHNVPTTFFLDATGRIMAWAPSQITETSVFEAYLENAIKGSGAVTEQFVETSMMDLEGGVHSSYERTSEATLAGDVLSESQGVMLEYAALAGNQELFDKILTFIDTKMLSDKGLTAWWVRKDKASPVSALIDDLRIYDGLNTANELWDGYDTYLEKYRTALAEYGIKDDYFVDFYDSEHKDYATRFTLCYGDLKTMEELSKEDDSFTLPYEHAKEIVENGMISEEFPLFYSWYNLDTEKYEEDELNMAEAMVTLLHLAEVGELPDESLEWLKSAMAGSGVKARYTVEGKVVEGYNFDSTAVYGIIAMIGDTLGDNELRGDALNKMEKMRIVDSSLDYNGAFGLEDGTGITSFDQIMPMLAYEYANN